MQPVGSQHPRSAWPHRARALALLLTLGFGATGCSADTDASAAGVVSSGGSWRATLIGATTLQVGVAAARTVQIEKASGGQPGGLSASAAFVHTAMNHGGLVDPSASVTDNGAVAVTDLQPSMEGSWRLTLTLQDAAKAKGAETVAFDFEVQP